MQLLRSNFPMLSARRHIVKRFGAVTALRDVSMHLKKGEVLGLVGDNGAGKSTLIKILTGFVQPDGGEIFVNGEAVKLRSVTYARSLGIETVYQDLALVNQLSVYHNMFLNRELRQFRPAISQQSQDARAGTRPLEEDGGSIFPRSMSKLPGCRAASARVSPSPGLSTPTRRFSPRRAARRDGGEGRRVDSRTDP